MCTINKTNSSKKFCCWCFFRSTKELTALSHTNKQKTTTTATSTTTTTTSILCVLTDCELRKTHKSLSVSELFHSLFFWCYAKWFFMVIERKWTPLSVLHSPHSPYQPSLYIPSAVKEMCKLLLIVTCNLKPHIYTMPARIHTCAYHPF